MDNVFLKLRVNIEIEGDLAIAEREIIFFSKKYLAVYREDISQAEKLGFNKKEILSNARKGGLIGYIVKLNYININAVVLSSSFIQEVWTIDEIPTFNDKIFYTKGISTFCSIPAFALGELLSYMPKKEILLSDAKELVSYLAGKNDNSILEKVTNKSATSTPHAHGLHKYKAKFFPRLIRSILVQEVNGSKDITVLDPFVGSGTTLIESAFLGYDSIGVDIDKLSCLISRSKSELLNTTLKTINQDLAIYEQVTINKHQYHFPSWISRKFDRKNEFDEKASYENEISSLINATAKLNGAKPIFQTIISDAITRKFNIRMMGTGVPRFALEIQKSSLKGIVANNIKYLQKATSVIIALKSVYDLKLSPPEIINGNATGLDIPSNTIDIILTSPPYLPASSGREDYVIGKSISVTALGLLTEEEVKNIETGSTGSMANKSTFSQNGLPAKVYELYNWLKNDELRNIKADPTYSYYLDIKKALIESHRVLKSGGKAIYVIGKESVFYSFKTREILYKVECDKIFKQIATEAGFKIKDIIDVELDKKNRNARPRSLDKYFETVFILEKN